MTSDYFHFLNLIGVAFFAVAGTLLGYEKKVGGFGIVVVASVTALGGGSLRDLLLNEPVFWVADQAYLYSTYGATIIAIIFIRYLPHVSNYYFLLIDAVGMAIFNIVGIEKSLIEGTGMLIAITMGTTTGIFGGLIRDVICREVPSVMRGEMYASACVAGGLAYGALFYFGAPYIWCILGSLFTTVFLRMGALHWDWQLKFFKKRYRQ